MTFTGQGKRGPNLFSNSASFSSLSWITWFNDETFPSFCLMFCSNRCIEPRDSSSSRTLKQTEVITSMTAQGGAVNCTCAIILIIHTASRRYVPHYALYSSSSTRKGASRLTLSFSPVPTTSPNVIAPFPFLWTSGHTISSLSFLRASRHTFPFSILMNVSSHIIPLPASRTTFHQKLLRGHQWTDYMVKHNRIKDVLSKTPWYPSLKYLVA